MTFEYMHPLALRVRPRSNGNAATLFQTAPQSSNWPPANLEENEESYIVELAIPGFRPQDIAITLEADVLRIHGTPQPQETPAGRTYHLTEWANQAFTFRKHVPRPVLEEAIQAGYENGVLRVTLPKAPEAKPRTIQITTEKE